jgi:protein SCO1/2
MASNSRERETLLGFRPMNRRPKWLSLALGAVAAVSVAACAGKPRAPAASDIGGPFHLVNQAGQSVDQRVLDGKWSAVFFGYTFCPDVCPTTLTALGRATDDLGANGRHFQVVFITVDPARDSPKALATYLSSTTFPKGAIGLTGTPDEIAQVAKAYHVFYEKHPDGGTYTMDHTAVVYLMDPEGRFVKPLDLTAPTADVARQITQAMNSA